MLSQLKYIIVVILLPISSYGQGVDFDVDLLILGKGGQFILQDSINRRPFSKIDSLKAMVNSKLDTTTATGLVSGMNARIDSVAHNYISIATAGPITDSMKQSIVVVSDRVTAHDVASDHQFQTVWDSIAHIQVMPGPAGQAGATGPQGNPGTDANVTSTSITNALGMPPILIEDDPIWIMDKSSYLLKDSAALKFQVAGSYLTSVPALYVKYLDTAAQMSGYLRLGAAAILYQPIGSYQPAGSYATTAQNAQKLNISDTGNHWMPITYTAPVVSFNSRLGTITLTNSDVTTALAYTPYDATNPAGYISSVPTTVMLKSDTPSLSNRINLKLNIGDTTNKWLSVNTTTTGIPEGTRLYYTDARSRAAISLTSISSINSYNSTTGVLNLAPQDFIDSSATSGTTGNAVFYLTSNRTAGGTALYSNVIFISPIVNNSVTNFTYGWTLSSDKKMLTVNVKGTGSANVLTTLLGAVTAVVTTPANVASGTMVNILVKGN